VGRRERVVGSVCTWVPCQCWLCVGCVCGGGCVGRDVRRPCVVRGACNVSESRAPTSLAAPFLLTGRHCWSEVCLQRQQKRSHARTESAWGSCGSCTVDQVRPWLSASSSRPHRCLLITIPSSFPCATALCAPCRPSPAQVGGRGVAAGLRGPVKLRRPGPPAPVPREAHHRVLRCVWAFPCTCK
jgi:hypothetical protein